MDVDLLVQNALGDGFIDRINDVFSNRHKIELRLSLIDADVFEDQHRIIRARQAARVAQQSFSE